MVDDDDDDSRGKVWKGQTEVNQRPMVDDVQRLKVEGWMDPRKGRWNDSGLRGKEEGESWGRERERKEWVWEKRGRASHRVTMRSLSISD